MRTDIELLLDCGRLWADAASKVGNRAGMIGKLGASSLGTLLRAAASALIGVGLAVSGAGAQDIPIDKLAQSKVFYDIKGGQTYLVPKNSKLGSIAESIQAESTDYDANSDIWGLQPGEPPTGLAMVSDGPHVGKNFYDSTNTGTGSVRALLVDPATGLVHYFAIMGVVLGHGRHILVPASGVDLQTRRMTAAPRQLRLMDFYSKSEIAAAYPPGQIATQIIAAGVALIPTSVIKDNAPAGLGDASGKHLTEKGLLVGVPVVGPNGQQIGEVRYLAVDKKTGEAALVFVTVSFFGPDANIAVRPTELKMKGDKLEIDRTPDQLMASPKFGKVDLINHYGAE